MTTDYLFSDRERLFFERLQIQFNLGVQSGIQMLCTQQSLDGQWRIKADGSGLEQVEIPFHPEPRRFDLSEPKTQ